MSNPYFQFKQFTVYQDQCAMKVSTDACVFGAWMANIAARRGSDTGAPGNIADGGGSGASSMSDASGGVTGQSATRVLDIGAGTGLLSLMVAQQSKADVTAVEIEPGAFIQAASNMANSPWASRLHMIQGDINELTFHDRLFDVIVTNPPFFFGDLRSEEAGRNLARHGDSLSLPQLINVIDNSLTPDGVAGILLPSHRVALFLEEAGEAGFYCKEKVMLRQTPAHSYFRGMLLLARTSGAGGLNGPGADKITERELAIRDGDNYTSGFKELLKDYYLHL